MEWNMRYFIITFGCQMNKSDSERIATVLEKDGYKPASKISGADLVVVNMCSVRQSAVNRIYGLALKFANLKAKKPNLKTILTGCVLKQDALKLKRIFDQILKFGDLLKYQPKRQNKSLVLIPISNGCNNFCSYCVVPSVRGPLVCRDHKEILKEVKNAVKNGSRPHTKREQDAKGAKIDKVSPPSGVGAREIWLLGQNVNDYCSPADKSIDFPKLLKMVNDVPGDFIIRFISPNPNNFSDGLIEVMVKSEKVAKFLNLPVQSGDNQILKKMKRPYTVEQYKNLVKKIRKKIPDINLSTDVIVGFPTETKKQFENTVKLFKEIKFDMAYIARYSPRPGTAAFKLKDGVAQKEKQRRWKILNDIILKKKGENDK